MLALDEDLRRYLPELLLPVPVTLRQCLSHTSGLREYDRCASWRACRWRAWMRRGSCSCWPGRPVSTSARHQLVLLQQWFVLAAAALRRVAALAG